MRRGALFWRWAVRRLLSQRWLAGPLPERPLAWFTGDGTMELLMPCRSWHAVAIFAWSMHRGMAVALDPDNWAVLAREFRCGLYFLLKD